MITQKKFSNISILVMFYLCFIISILTIESGYSVYQYNNTNFTIGIVTSTNVKPCVYKRYDSECHTNYTNEIMSDYCIYNNSFCQNNIYDCKNIYDRDQYNWLHYSYIKHNNNQFILDSSSLSILDIIKIILTVTMSSTWFIVYIIPFSYVINLYDIRSKFASLYVYITYFLMIISITMTIYIPLLTYMTADVFNDIVCNKCYFIDNNSNINLFIESLNCRSYYSTMNFPYDEYIDFSYNDIYLTIIILIFLLNILTAYKIRNHIFKIYTYTPHIHTTHLHTHIHTHHINNLHHIS